MPPGGETSRYSGRFGENVLRHGSHEWLPYSKDEVLLECSNTNLSQSSVLQNNSPRFCFQVSTRSTAASSVSMGILPD